jgi:chromosome segregation ATPase
MTSTRYWIARFAQAFGYNRRNHRMSDAASEMHLLQEAEAFLGSRIWKNVEQIEALSVEYWNLRKLIKEHDIAQEKLLFCEETLQRAHDARGELLNATPESDQNLLEQRNAQLLHLEGLAKDRDSIVIEAREVRRSYVGLKMKLEVLTKELDGAASTPEEIAKVKEKLQELKDRFETLKKDRIKVGELIELGDKKVDAIDQQLQEHRQKRRGLASETFQAIGERNKDISVLRAETALINTKMRHLYAEIGRYISRNAKHDPACSKASEKYHSMIDVMRALRRSITLNHRLAGTA